MDKYNVKDKVRVTTHMSQFNTNQKWSQAFNSVLFCNYDAVNPVYVNNDFIIPPAQTIGGIVYATYFSLSLNAGEINSESGYFNLDFRGSASAHLVIIHTEYNTGL